MSGKISGGITIALIIVILFSSSSALSTASSEWSEAVNLSEWQSDLFSSFSLELAENGTLAAYWVRINAATEWSLWARLRSPSGEWGPAENLSGWIQPGQLSGGGILIVWEAAFAPDGSAWAAWVEDTSTPGGRQAWVRAAFRAPGEPWQRDDPSVGYDKLVQSLELVFGPQGHGLITWTDCTDESASSGICQVRARRRLPEAPAWGVLEGLDDPATGYPIEYVQALAGPQGDFVVLWDERDTITLQTVYWSLAFDGQSRAWEAAPTDISGPRTSFYQTEAVIDPAGTVTAGFTAVSSSGQRSNYAVTRNAADGSWSLPVQISDPADSMSGPRLAVGQDGTVTAAWQQKHNTLSEDAIFANTRPAGGAWQSSPQQVTPWRAGMSDPYLGIWPGGSTLLVWSEQDASRPASEDEAVYYSVRPAAGLWGEGGEGQIGGRVEDVFFNMDLEVAQDGGAALIWAVTETNQPAGQQQAVFSALWPPGGQWGPPERLSEWQDSVWVTRQNSLVLGQTGQPLAAEWYESHGLMADKAIFVRTMGMVERQVLIPLVLRPPGE